MKNYELISLIMVCILINTDVYGQSVSVPENRLISDFGGDILTELVFDKDDSDGFFKDLEFNTWKKVELFDNAGNKFIVDSVNIDLIQGVFYYINEDVLYSGSNKNISTIVSESRMYKTFETQDLKKTNYKLFEVLADGKGFTLLKSVKKKSIKVIDSPMGLSSKNHNREWVKYDKLHCFDKVQNKTIEIKNKRKSILKILNGKKKNVKDFVRQNKLSYRNTDDVKLIFQYFDTL